MNSGTAHAIQRGAPPETPAITIGEERFRTGLDRYHTAGDPTGALFLAKMPLRENADTRAQGRYARELDASRALAGDGILAATESVENGRALLVASVDVIPLRLAGRERVTGLANALAIGEQAARALSRIHRARIVHTGISPDSILVGNTLPADGDGPIAVLIGDLGLSRNADDAEPERRAPHPGLDPRYFSPESTGRINRVPDYTSDLYSLGVVLYELLTGVCPFASPRPADVIYGHIALIPTDPREHDASIPSSVAAILMKLLAKNSPDRYRTAEGLRLDLARCRSELRATGSISHFSAGDADGAGVLRKPSRLHGRDRERDEIMERLERARNGASCVTIVTGQPGVGKTALAASLACGAGESGGMFVSGKFELTSGQAPHGALVQAMRSLVSRMLIQSDNAVGRWRDRLLGALQPNARIILDLIPDLGHILGEQPEAPITGPIETANRLNTYFARFVAASADECRPLVMFLDDLQWADPANLSMLFTLATDPAMKHLHLIGAYRDIEVDAAHPLSGTLDEIAAAGVSIHRLHLKPLAREHLRELAADVIDIGDDAIDRLADILFSRTRGNPLHSLILIRDLVDRGLLAFGSGGWRLDETALRSLPVSDTLAGHLGERIMGLPGPTRRLLAAASMIGGDFHTQLLSRVTDLGEEEVSRDLDGLVREGYIRLTDGGAWRIAHDRILEAASALVDADEAARLHLAIGRFLLDELGDDPGDRLFAVADHLNRAGTPVGADEAVRLAEINLRAGERAMSSGAFESARSFFRCGMDAIGLPGAGEAWRTRYDLSFALCRHRAETEYLCGDPDAFNDVLESAFAFVSDPLDRSKLDILRAQQLAMGARHRDSVSCGIDALHLLGIDFPRDNFKAAVAGELARIEEHMRDRDIVSIYNNQEITDPAFRNGLKIMNIMLSGAYHCDPDLFLLTLLKMVSVSFIYGNTTHSCAGYIGYGNLLTNVFFDFIRGHDYGLLGVQLQDKFHDQQHSCSVTHQYANHIVPWNKHIRETESLNDKAYKAGTESGELYFATINRHHQLINRYHAGYPLDELQTDFIEFLSQIRAMKQYVTMNSNLSYICFIANISGNTISADSFDSEYATDEQHAWNMTSENAQTSLCQYNILRAQALYLYCQYERALPFVERAQRDHQHMMGCFHVAELNCTHSLILAALCDSADGDRRTEFLNAIRENQRTMKKWSDNCPANFLHKYLLVEAERARLDGNNAVATDLYDAAIESAGANGFVQNEAIANECAGRFWLARGKHDFAALYLERARRGYARWGARRKVWEMNAQYPDILAPVGGDRTPHADTPTIPVEPMPANVDLEAVFRASTALSQEIDLDRLLERVVDIILRNSGARRMALAIEHDGEYFIEAEGRFDDERSGVRT
ncbi:MAG TPA: AAA family ATPase, partial [Spirochaetota bacterium]|nr:AAA family ATPase [Spirochaetota bacterium]